MKKTIKYLLTIIMCIITITSIFTACSSAKATFDSQDIINSNPQIGINGKTYTIGETTLQNMIDDGVEFSSDKYMDTTVEADSSSNTFFVLEDKDTPLNSVSFIFYNKTNEEQSVKECVLRQISYLSTDGSTKSNKNKFIEFNFPLNMTEDELKVAAGEPKSHEETNSTHKYYYEKISSDKENIEYIFTYNLSGKLTQVTMKSVILVDVTDNSKEKTDTSAKEQDTEELTDTEIQ